MKCGLDWGFKQSSSTKQSTNHVRKALAAKIEGASAKFLSVPVGISFVLSSIQTNIQISLEKRNI